MATPNELIEYIQDEIKDISYDGEIFDFLQEAVEWIDGSMRPLILRPELEVSANVTAEAYDADDLVYRVALPSNYGKHLYKVVSANEETSDIDILSTLSELLERWDTFDNNASVQSVVPVGGYLYYQGIPSTEDTLTLYYYKPMTNFVRGTNTEITELPSWLQRKLFVHYVAHLIYEQKGFLEKSDRHMAKAEAYLRQLSTENRHGSRQHVDYSRNKGVYRI